MSDKFLGSIFPDHEIDAPQHITKEEFGKRLYRIMLARNITQSELARRADTGRSNINNYVRGKAWPEAHNLINLANALRVEPRHLLPEGRIPVTMAEPTSEFEMKAIPGNPTKMRVRLNTILDRDAAAQIMAIINADVAKSA